MTASPSSLETDERRRHRERTIRGLQKYITNPPVKLVVSLGLMPTTALLETTGRISGKRRRTPVGNGYDHRTQTVWIVAEHGDHAAWVRNVRADPRVRIKIHGRWRTGSAHPLPEDDPRLRQRTLGKEIFGQRITAAAVRAMGTQLLTVRVDLDPKPARPRAPTIGEGRPSRTAEINAAQRAAETMQPPHRRLIDDPQARAFVAKPHYRALLATAGVARAGLRVLDLLYPGLHVEIVLRARYVDDAVAAAHAAGIDQLVLLGAGYDSTAYRDSGAPPLTIYEVDAPATQEAKLARIRREAIKPRQTLVHVPCDFESDSVGARLAEHTFDAARPALVVWLGVSYYLTREALERTLAGVAAFSAPGSRLIFDYMDPEVISGTTPYAGARRVARNIEKRGEPYRLGLTPVSAAQALQTVGFDVIETLRVPQLAARYSGPGGVWCSTEDWMGLLLGERR